MMTIIHIIISIIRAVAMLIKPGGYKKLVMENLMLKQQLVVCSRKYKKAPPLKMIERILFAISLFFIPLKRLSKIAVIVSPETILKFHKALVKKKYQILFGSKGSKNPGRKGFDKDMVNLVIEIKTKNPSYGCPRISMLVSNITGISISEQTVRRILRKHFKLEPGNGPSWLSFIGNQIDSLWSIDLFCCESISLKTHWIMAVMDQYSRRVIGFSVQKGQCTGANVCRMFNEIMDKSKLTPKRISTDHDPLFESHRWKANLRIFDIEEIKTLPEIPFSHPFIERLIGSTRRECIDKVLFWNEADLKRKLDVYQKYYNKDRIHYALDGVFPEQYAGKVIPTNIDPKNYRWKNCCNGLYRTPVAA